MPIEDRKYYVLLWMRRFPEDTNVMPGAIGYLLVFDDSAVAEYTARALGCGIAVVEPSTIAPN